MHRNRFSNSETNSNWFDWREVFQKKGYDKGRDHDHTNIFAINMLGKFKLFQNLLTLSAVGGGAFNAPHKEITISITTPKSNDTDLKKFDFS